MSEITPSTTDAVLVPTMTDAVLVPTMTDAVLVSPFYYSAVNEVTKPNSLVFVSHYFVDRWMRDLGPVGSAIVTVLRSHCYQNRSTGELRNRVQLSARVIAAEIGVSVKTVRREMESNQALLKFLKRREEYAPGPTPQSLRVDAYSYLVAMDDPVHPLDDELLQDVIRKKIAEGEKGEGDAKARARSRQNLSQAQTQKPCGQNDHTANQGTAGRVVKMTTPLVKMTTPLVKMTTPLVKMTTPLVKMTTPPGQNDHTLIESFESLEFKKNPSSEFSASLLEESEKTLALAPEWQDLTESEQKPFLEQAAAELAKLHDGTGIKPSFRLVEVRALNLYKVARK